MPDILKTCFEKAINAIKNCSTPNGLFASCGKNGYDAIWSRDSMVSMLGASLINKSFKEVFKQSLIILAKNQSIRGQIPNCVDMFSRREPHTDFQTIDSSLWYIIGHFVYRERYGDNSLFKKYKDSIKKALTWLSYQDPGEIGMLAQLSTTDWQDAFPHKYGHTINTQALYYKVLLLIGEKKQAEKLKYLVNKNDSTRLWDKDFYLAFRWKNHRKYREIGEWFDSLGNLLAIVFELADKAQAEKILNYIEKNKINEPYPVKTIYPPITKKSKHWQDYYLDCDAGKPNSYSNGGIWGYNGCFYILSLIKFKKFDEAERELKKLAERNLAGNFPEWTHPITKKHYGSLQAWEAGMFILAYLSLKKRKVLI